MSKILIDEAVVRQALEALENHPGNYKLSKAECAEYRAVEDALRKSMSDAALDKMADNARELGLSYEQPDHIRDATKKVEQPAPPECKTEAEKTAFAFGWFKALESVRKEPVIQPWMKPDALCDRSCLYACTEGFTKFPTCVPPTAPAQDPDELTIAYLDGMDAGKKRKPWVGLTDEEIDDIEATWEATQEWVSFSHATRVIEAKLKEKNT